VNQENERLMEEYERLASDVSILFMSYDCWGRSKCVDVQFLSIYFLAFGMDQAYITVVAEPTG